MTQAFIEEWKEDSTTRAALAHLAARITVALGELRAAAEASTDPKVQAARAVLHELEELQKALQEGRF